MVDATHFHGALRRVARRLFRCDSGQDLVEFALTSTVFLITILGTMEFGLAIWRYNMVSDLAQEGARWAAVRGINSNTTPVGSVANLTSFVQSRANSVPISSVTVTSPSGATGACTSTAVVPSSLIAGQGICVTVQATYAPLTGFVPAGLLNLQSTAKMVMAR